jgi:sulfide:quinone oxidoreductase
MSGRTGKKLSRRAFLGWSAGAMVAGRVVLARGESSRSGSTTVILGGGVGGIVLAKLLREALPAPHRIQLVERGSSFHLGTTKTWVMLGQSEPEDVIRPLDLLAKGGIELLRSEIHRIDPEKRTFETDGGTLRADYLVIALGADYAMGRVEGLEQAAHTFYTMEGALRLREALRGFEGGEVVLIIPRTPFKCPPGPYEGMMLLRAFFRRRGLEGKTRLRIVTVEKSPMATAGAAIGGQIQAALAERSIDFQPRKQTQRVDPAAKRIVLEDGGTIPYDLLLAIPPHEAPRAVRDSGLTGPSGWIPVEPQTLELVSTHDAGRVFAIGDVTALPLPGRHQPDAPLVLPKAGVFAERQAAVVAGRIAAHVLGREPAEAFDGKGYCYIEMDEASAMRGDGSFFEMPAPTMVAREPDAAQLAEKKSWVAKWMETYLGA